MSSVWETREQTPSLSGRSSPDPQNLRLRFGPSPGSGGAAVLAKVKFCGMTRPVDAAIAGEIGANYVGVVFAEGPRRVTPRDGRTILDAAGENIRRVGVFGTNDPDAIARAAEEARLDVV